MFPKKGNFISYDSVSANDSHAEGIINKICALLIIIYREVNPLLSGTTLYPSFIVFDNRTIYTGYSFCFA